MNRTKISCPHCARPISKSNYTKHVASCDGTYFEGPNKPKEKKDPLYVQRVREESLEKARLALSQTEVWNKGKFIVAEDEVFKIDGHGPIKKLFMSKVEYKCSCCGLQEWQGNPITLDLDHINGNNKDHRFENLRLLCPNCHSQTPTYKNKGKAGKKASDAALISAIMSSKNTSEALQKSGLQPQGANYERVKRIIEKYNLIPTW